MSLLADYRKGVVDLYGRSGRGGRFLLGAILVAVEIVVITLIAIEMLSLLRLNIVLEHNFDQEQLYPGRAVSFRARVTPVTGRYEFEWILICDGNVEVNEPYSFTKRALQVELPLAYARSNVSSCALTLRVRRSSLVCKTVIGSVTEACLIEVPDFPIAIVGSRPNDCVQNHPQCWDIRGQAALEKGELLEAYHFFARAIAIDSTYTLGLIHVADVCEELGDYRCAVSALEVVPRSDSTPLLEERLRALGPKAELQAQQIESRRDEIRRKVQKMYEQHDAARGKKRERGSRSDLSDAAREILGLER